MFYLQIFVVALAIVASNAWFERRGWKRGYARGKSDGLDVGKQTLQEVTREQLKSWKGYADSLCDRHRKASEENSREWAAHAEREYKRGRSEAEQEINNKLTPTVEQLQASLEELKGVRLQIVELRSQVRNAYKLGFDAGKLEAEGVRKPAARKCGIARKIPAKLTKKTAKAKK